MTSSRERFLERVREAVEAGSRAGDTAALAARGQTGYQGAGPDPVARFCGECTAAGGFPYVVPDRTAASAKVIELVQAKAVRRALLGRGSFLDSLELSGPLAGRGVEVTRVDALAPASSRDPFFAADLGISGVDYLIAETGSVALFARPTEPRSLSLLPPVHIAVAEGAQLLPDLFDLFSILSRQGQAHQLSSMPSCLSLITGPSKTGDIELRLVT